MTPVQESELEKFKREIEEDEELLLTQPPEYIYSKLWGFVKLGLLFEDLKLDKKELEKYAKKLGKRYISELELTDFPPDIAEKIKEKTLERLRKSIEKRKRIYERMLQLNDKIEEAVSELERARYSPFEINGVKYSGDVFYSWINDYVEGKFGKDIDEQLALLIFCEIADRLRRDGYYVHG
jgi:vacuolar-type H+-ATPase subunit I/STV1